MKREKTAGHTRRAVLQSIAVAAMSLPLAGAALAEGWPTGSVQLIVTAKAGGGTDAGARVIAAKLQEITGQPFVVVNNAGGGGAIAVEQVRTARPDGRTLLFGNTGFLSTYHTGGYDHAPTEDFTVLGSLPVGGSFGLTVAADSPYQTVEDLVAAAKANPDKITLGITMRGGTHFMAGLFQKDSGAPFRFVDAGTDADKWVQVQGHQIDATLTNTPGTLQYVEAGDLRILATIAGTPERDPGAPDIPSMHELGYASTVYGVDFMVLGPKDMATEDVSAISAAFTQALEDPATAEQLAKMKMPISPMSAEDSVVRLRAIDQKVAETAKALGLTAN